MTILQIRQPRQLIYLLISCIIFSSCSSDKSTIKSYLKEIGVELTNEIEVKKCDIHGITDFILEAEFEITDNDKQKIINLIKQTKDYDKSTRSEPYLDNEWTSSSMTDSTYFLSVRVPTKNAFKQHNLQLFNKTNVVKYDYWEE